MRLPLLQVRDLRIGFQAEDVVKGISFNLDLGEKLALVGESGSGKSVTALSFVKLLEGARVSGRVLWTAQDADTLAPEATDAPHTHDLVKLSERELINIRGQDIAFVFQEPMTALNPLMMVGDQIAEVLELKRGMTREEAWHEAVELLSLTGIPEPVRRASAYPHQLSGGQRQRVMIAMALACRPRLLVADEPTTALDVSLRAQILDLLNDLQKRFGMAVLLITHDLNTVRRFADQVLVMEKGVIVESGKVDVVLTYPTHPYTQKLIDSQPPRNVVEAKNNAPAVMQARALRVSYPMRRAGWRGWFKGDQFVAVQGASFDLRAGQTLGVIGESGSGKTTLALAALGLMPSEGTLTIDGVAWQGKSASDLPLRRKVQVVFQDPFSSLSPRMNVQELVSEGLTLHAPELDDLGRLRRMLVTLAAVGLTETEFPGLLQRYPHEFSGGQRQRLAIARALVVEPQVLVLDEPTSALDATTQLQVLQLLQKLQRERGLSYLLITHDVSVIRAMAHHVMVMQAGKVVEAGTFEQVLNNPQAPYTKILVGAAA
ncbi:microcin ABC transporter ATP-binding protein [Limnohabitans sp. TS-CS-82]|jgi:microcin C transport system ATP-binding protein|uniref:ABC transporter ATP-binding protein n=1 Tax=Limnohabitans sp. TS-CS-82 TaxID=2094193 RepID=UPI000CF2ACED|nr:dipeptide ABC transporter ATP-binding protein [Limnohabitans sp. TS-CS-82]PQA83921.1 microcin ABC transporter ATP-binding protein [Limnohabitans sp. TS-CS-82]